MNVFIILHHLKRWACPLRRLVSGFRSPLGSGNANNGAYAGLAYFNGNYAPSTANVNLSSPHYLGRVFCVCIPVPFEAQPRLLPENISSEQVSVGP